MDGFGPGSQGKYLKTGLTQAAKSQTKEEIGFVLWTLEGWKVFVKESGVITL